MSHQQESTCLQGLLDQLSPIYRQQMQVHPPVWSALYQQIFRGIPSGNMEERDTRDRPDMNWRMFGSVQGNVTEGHVEAGCGSKACCRGATV